jgi:hypothetical protein
LEAGRRASLDDVFLSLAARAHGGAFRQDSSSGRLSMLELAVSGYEDAAAAAAALQQQLSQIVVRG